MAEFNPDTRLSETQVQDQSGASRGTGPNQAFEALFSGIGDAITGIAKTGDNFIQNKIEDEARYGYESTNDEFGLSASTVPAEITRSNEGLQKLAQAHMQGGVTNEYYTLRLASTLKGLRARYPGYEREVDQIVQRVTGMNPANAFRDALLSNINQQQQALASSQGKWESWAGQKENSEVLGILYPDFWTNQEKYSSPDQQAAIRANVSQYQGRTRLAEDTVKLQNADKTVARPQLGQLFSTITNGYIVGGANAVGVDTPNVQNMITRALADGTVDQNEKEGILGMLAQVKAKAVVDMRNRAASSDWSNNFTSQEINEEVANSIKPIEEMEQLVSSDNVSAAVRIAERNKAVTDQATADIYKKFPELGVASALKNISMPAADELTNQVIEKNGGGMSFINKTLAKDTLDAVTTGNMPIDQALDAVATAGGKSAKEKESVLATVVDGATTYLTDPKTPNDVKKNTVKNVYSTNLDKLWASVDDSTNASGSSQRFRLYNKMFNPAITKSIKEMNDPEALRQYTAAAVDKFQQIPEFRRSAQTLNEDLPYAKYARVHYDTERNRLVVEVNREALGNTGFFTRSDQGQLAKNLTRTVDGVNQALSIMSPIIEANGADEAEGVSTLFRDLNLDLNAGKKTGFFGFLNDVLEGNLDPDNGVAKPGSKLYEAGKARQAERQKATDPEQTGRFIELGTGETSNVAPGTTVGEQPGDMVNEVLQAGQLNYAPEQGSTPAENAIYDQLGSNDLPDVPDDVEFSLEDSTPDSREETKLQGGGSWLQYANQGATRNKPLSEPLVKAMSFLPDLGVTMQVFSGGQDASGPNRTGSHRHDHGNAADVFFYKDGRRLDWSNPEDRVIFEQIVREGKARGITGFGAGPGYMRQGSMHLGFGSNSVWGAGGRGENAPSWLVNAYNN